MRNDRSLHPLARRPLAALALLLVASILTLAFVAGCGGGSNAPAESPQTSAPEETAPPAAAGTDAGATETAAGDLGSRVFEQRCVLCHGKSGMGDGAAAAGLNPKPRDLRDAAYMSSRTDDQLLEIIRNGKGAMPAWGKNNTLSEDEIQAVLKHIRTFTAGS